MTKGFTRDSFRSRVDLSVMRHGREKKGSTRRSLTRHSQHGCPTTRALLLAHLFSWKEEEGGKKRRKCELISALHFTVTQRAACFGCVFVPGDRAHVAPTNVTRMQVPFSSRPPETKRYPPHSQHQRNTSQRSAGERGRERERETDITQ